MLLVWCFFTDLVHIFFIDVFIGNNQSILPNHQSKKLSINVGNPNSI